MCVHGVRVCASCVLSVCASHAVCMCVYTPDCMIGPIAVLSALQSCVVMVLVYVSDHADVDVMLDSASVQSARSVRWKRVMLAVCQMQC